MSTLSASEQIEELERQIVQLKKQAYLELQQKLAEAQQAVDDLEHQLEQITGKAVSSEAPTRRARRPSIDDETLKPMVLKAMAQYGMTGLNAREIASYVGQDPLRVRKFIAQNPPLLKRQGSGPGTRFFLP